MEKVLTKVKRTPIEENTSLRTAVSQLKHQLQEIEEKADLYEQSMKMETLKKLNPEGI